MSAKPRMYYTMVCDVSPSEQLGNEPTSERLLAMAVGLNERHALEHVGSAAKQSTPLLLRKWAGATQAYKRRFIQHATELSTHGSHAFGFVATTEESIRIMGGLYFQVLMGIFPEPSSHNKHGRPRVELGGFRVEGVEVPCHEVLIDDLCVIGWYASAIAGFHGQLCKLNCEHVGLDVLIDRLPNEQGGERCFKAVVMKEALRRATEENAVLVGVPTRGDALQRDLLVDNLAGFARETRRSTQLEGLGEVFGFHRDDDGFVDKSRAVLRAFPNGRMGIRDGELVVLPPAPELR